MPTYQYACTECGHRMEAVQSFSDAPLTICDECQGKLRKVFSAVGVVFKGSGFYRTDSRSAASASPKSSSSASSSAGSSDSSGSSGSSSSESSSGSSASSASSSGSASGSSPAPATKSA